MATQTPPLTQPQPTQAADFLPLKGTDHVEFYVGNARQSAYFYRAAFGMSLVAYAGPETGQRDRASYVLEQGKIRFVLTTALRADSDIARHVLTHGDGVRAIALWVDDARKSWEETTKRGARSIQAPTDFSDAHGRVTTSSIAAYGDTSTHSSNAPTTTEPSSPAIRPSKKITSPAPSASSTSTTSSAT